MNTTIDRALGDACDALAGDRGVSMTTLVEALVAGVLKTGQVQRMFEAGMETPALRNRRNKGAGYGLRSRWPAETKGHRRQGEWDLVRLGVVGQRQSTDDGWYLTGPDVKEPLFVGSTISEALPTAQALVDSRQLSH